eukprot:Rmarinus@m.14535
MGNHCCCPTLCYAQSSEPVSERSSLLGPTGTSVPTTQHIADTEATFDPNLLIRRMNNGLDSDADEAIRGRNSYISETGEETLGDIRVGWAYDPIRQQLRIRIIEARNLAGPEDGSPCNPYVKMYLVPDKGRSSKKKTQVIPGTDCPEWHQSFSYRLPAAVRKTRQLHIMVWDYVRSRRNEFIGEVFLPCAAAPDITGNDSQLVNAWYKLQSRPEEEFFD